MKLTFTKGTQKIVIDDKGKGINGILTTDKSKTDYPQIKLTKGTITKYFRTKWEVDKSVTIQKMTNGKEALKESKLDMTIKIDPSLKNTFISGNINFQLWSSGPVNSHSLAVYFDGNSVHNSTKDPRDTVLYIPIPNNKCPSSVRIVYICKSSNSRFEITATIPSVSITGKFSS